MFCLKVLLFLRCFRFIGRGGELVKHVVLFVLYNKKHVWPLFFSWGKGVGKACYDGFCL